MKCLLLVLSLSVLTGFADPMPPKRTTLSSTYFLPDNFVEGTKLPTGKDADLSQLKQKMLMYYDYQDLNENQFPGLETHGFQKLDLFRLAQESGYQEWIEQLRELKSLVKADVAGFVEAERQFRLLTADLFESHPVRNIIGRDYDAAIFFDAVFRSTDPENLFQPIPVAHIDFSGTYLEIFNTFRNRWESSLSDRIGYGFMLRDLGRCSKDDLIENLDSLVVAALHIWMPLTQPYSSNTLLLGDFRTLKEGDALIYTAVRRPQPNSTDHTFKAVGIKYSNNIDWYADSKLQYGEGYLFFDRKTPHLSSSLDDTRLKRDSLEMRFFIVRKSASLPVSGETHHLQNDINMFRERCGSHHMGI